MKSIINTVLGTINESEVKACLCHEHICCYSEYLMKMAGRDYIDKERLASKSIAELKRLKSTYGVNLFVDCTPINIGRDVDFLKKVSVESGVHIVCSTGFYYTDEPVLYNTSEDYINKKLKIISTLCKQGFKNRIILSHDELFFNGFDKYAKIKDDTRFDYVFRYILPYLKVEVAERIIRKNPVKMLKCREED